MRGILPVIAIILLILITIASAIIAFMGIIRIQTTIGVPTAKKILARPTIGVTHSECMQKGDKFLLAVGIRNEGNVDVLKGNTTISILSAEGKVLAVKSVENKRLRPGEGIDFKLAYKLWGVPGEIYKIKVGMPNADTEFSCVLTTKTLGVDLAPRISIIQPTTKDVLLNVTIEAKGNDDFGLTKISLSLDGQSHECNVSGTSATCSYTFTCDKGSHTIVATARDISGQTSSATMSIYCHQIYRVPMKITFSNGISGTYSIPLHLDTKSLIEANKLFSDCSNMRFYQLINGNLVEIPYYIDYGCNTNRTKIWVKVNLSNGNATIYWYYNNPFWKAKSSFNDAMVGSSNFEKSLSGIEILDAEKWIKHWPEISPETPYSYGWPIDSMIWIGVNSNNKRQLIIGYAAQTQGCGGIGPCPLKREAVTYCCYAVNSNSTDLKAEYSYNTSVNVSKAVISGNNKYIYFAYERDYIGVVSCSPGCTICQYACACCMGGCGIHVKNISTTGGLAYPLDNYAKEVLSIKEDGEYFYLAHGWVKTGAGPYVKLRKFDKNLNEVWSVDLGTYNEHAWVEKAGDYVYVLSDAGWLAKVDKSTGSVVSQIELSHPSALKDFNGHLVVGEGWNVTFLTYDLQKVKSYEITSCIEKFVDFARDRNGRLMAAYVLNTTCIAEQTGGAVPGTAAYPRIAKVDDPLGAHTILWEKSSPTFGWLSDEFDNYILTLGPGGYFTKLSEANVNNLNYMSYTIGSEEAV